MVCPFLLKAAFLANMKGSGYISLVSGLCHNHLFRAFRMELLMRPKGTYNRVYTLKHLLSTILLLLSYSSARSVVSATRLSLKVPVNPVPEGGMLSIHCQIFDLDPAYEVTLSRQLGDDNQRLSWNLDLLQSVEDRVFLAIRQLEDGSVVYFMSITEVNKSDQGKYSCRILSLAGDLPRDIQSESVSVYIQYFPDSPECKTEQGSGLESGQKVTVTCSANRAEPDVDLQWKRTGEGDLSGASLSTRTTSDRRFTSITLQVRPDDDQIILVCQMMSDAFPERMATCHVGPIKVSGNTDVKPSVAMIPGTGTHTDISVTHDVSTALVVRKTTKDQEDITECRKSCSTLTITYWILATAIGGFLALILFIGTIALLFKLYKLNQSPYCKPRTGVTLQRRQTRDIYVELDKGGKDAKVYMSLDRCKKRGDVSVYS